MKSFTPASPHHAFTVWSHTQYVYKVLATLVLNSKLEAHTSISSPIPSTPAQVEAKAAVVLESVLDTDPARYQVSGSCPFVVHTVQGRLVCCVAGAESCRFVIFLSMYAILRIF